MSFLLRTAFWLGLTFNAMPWGDARWTDVVPDARAALGTGLATQSRDQGGVAAIARAVLSAALEPRPASPAAQRVGPSPQARRASVDTLSAADRLPPWRGPVARSAS
ncbi:MAG: hypothetical protein ABR929_09180 [Roseiarcus sp.]|jgi:hypothetical protein